MNNSDVFFEQIISVKKNAKTYLAIVGIFLLALILIAILFTVLYSSLSLLAAFGIIYGAYWLSSKLNVEFEYIITNGTMDIDKIINKSSRKRILSFELSTLSRLEKFNPAAITNKKDVVFACSENEDNAYYLVAQKNSGGEIKLVFAPNGKIQSAIEKFAPKFITNNVFKN